jgi:hypothetical protein
MVEKPSKTPKLDIFRVLNALNEKDAKFYDNLNDEEQKAFQPFLVMRWMSGTADALQVHLINEIANPYAFALANHKLLMWQLLVACNSGKKHKYNWLKLPSSSNPAKPISVKVVSQYFQYSTAHATDAVKLLSKHDILEFAEELGYQPDEMSKLKKEHSDDKSERTKS